MFNKKEWVLKSLKSGYDKGLWTAEHIMENSMKYSMAGVLDDADLEELAAYTEPVVEEDVMPDEALEEEQESVEEGAEGEESASGEAGYQSAFVEEETEDLEPAVDENNM